MDSAMSLIVFSTGVGSQLKIETVKILNWEPMPWEQAFIEHAKSIEAIKDNT